MQRVDTKEYAMNSASVISPFSIRSLQSASDWARLAVAVRANGLLYCHEATNITGKRVVNRYRTQLNDALIAYYVGLNS